MPNMAKPLEALARGLVAAGVKAGEVVAIFFAEFVGVLCGLIIAQRWRGAIRRCSEIPRIASGKCGTTLENSGAVFLITERAEYC